ncbi:FliA/WhiG family RNA polymerase sigma factor [Aminithiophilus ramosus]|uniref:RNA polymerase sigma factor n=2 Tax=Synergistales TaxID=649776 RepID=A0A9Q7AP56_9BACT|nr:FliA/WhiG family RNA polymerase sigma factor [Aminithiophilus ramosus]QTX31641.1 FliA/WhiG family RNA polymerase sigma factor [Aminithiophilus ramosus]QVL35448.1 FliA/WhiG family RNA polymerase sigma factor [Synergistota bacterium]
MSRESDRELWSDFASDPSAENREKLVVRYLPLVRYVANRMALVPPPGLDYEDLLSFGVFGLLDAMDRFDPRKGFVFQTFAVPRIRGAILDELRRYDWISRSGREKLSRLEEASERLYQSKGAIDEKELMATLEMDEKSYRELLEISGRTYLVSLDDVFLLEEGDVLRGGAVADEGPDAQSLLERDEERSRVASALVDLPERERLLLSLYYYEGLTLKEIGEVLGVTESRVSQLHGKAIAALRGRLRP